MKNFYLVIFLAFFIGISGCKKEDEKLENISVERYIELLKTNSYKEYKLPAFTSADIPALLQYRDETQTITDFPRNPISSMYGPECTLGMYVLWTIESIRTESGNNKMMGFPSQNPLLKLRYADELVIVNDSNVHAMAARVYFYWWEYNKGKSFDTFKTIDPLGKTDYAWH